MADRRIYESGKVAPAPWKRWQDWVAFFIGVWVAVSPWVYTVMDNYQTAALWLGIGIAVVALWALAKPTSKAAEWVNILLGALLALSPLIDFEKDFSVWNAIISGVLVAGLAAWALSTIDKVVVVREDVEDVPRR